MDWASQRPCPEASSEEICSDGWIILHFGPEPRKGGVVEGVLRGGVLWCYGPPDLELLSDDLGMVLESVFGVDRGRIAGCSVFLQLNKQKDAAGDVQLLELPLEGPGKVWSPQDASLTNRCLARRVRSTGSRK